MVVRERKSLSSSEMHMHASRIAVRDGNEIPRAEINSNLKIVLICFSS
jgi:hypothetical protein